MPSDPSGRYPIGVLARPPQDWFDDQMGYGGYYQTTVHPVGNNFCLVSLYNNAAGGAKLKVYGITAISDAGGGVFAWVDQGVPQGSLVGPCNPVAADAGGPYGVIYQKTITQANPLPNPFSIPVTAAILGASGFDSMTYFPPFPMFIVPAGYALHTVSASGAAQFGGAFWYQMANE